MDNIKKAKGSADDDGQSALIQLTLSGLEYMQKEQASRNKSDNMAERLAYLCRNTESAQQTDALKDIAGSAKSLEELRRIADLAEENARSALKKAKRADVLGIIAAVFSAISLFFELAINHAAISDFVKSLFSLFSAK